MAFEIPNECLTVALIFQVLDSSLLYQLWVDTSGFTCGGSLVQRTLEGHWLPVEYISHQFLAPESNYSATKYNLLAVLLALGRQHHYLLGSLFVVCSDHAGLQYLLLKPYLSFCQAWWLKIMGQIDLSFKYIYIWNNLIPNTLFYYPYLANEITVSSTLLDSI